MMKRLGLALVLSLLCAAGCRSVDSPAGGRVAAPDVLTASAYIEAPYDAVWAAFTQRERYGAWYSTPCLEFGRAAGERVAWGEGERTYYAGRLTHIQYGQGLGHTFRFEGFGFDEPASQVDIEIRPSGETVLVSLRHDCRNAPRTAELISPVGWTKSLSRLKTLLETGRAMPWPGGSEG